MKTSEFNCPIHNSTVPIVTLESCHIESWDNYICYECKAIKPYFDKVENWLRDTNSSLDEDVKRRLKISPLVYYDANYWGWDGFYTDIEDNDLSQAAYKIMYYKNTILFQHIYQTGWKTVKHPYFSWRIQYQTFKSIYTLDLDYRSDKIPLELLDDEALIEVNYKRKHSDG